MSERTVILGSEGMLGRAWLSLDVDGPHPALGLSRRECDLLDPDSVADAVGSQTRLVVNCAAYTDVDGAEADEAKAAAVNGVAVGSLARRCREVGATLIHFSTDYVFPGDANEPYRTDEPRRPLNAYGRSKALGEELIEASGADALVVRTSWLYAAHGANFVRTIARLCRERDELKVVDDQRGRPTSARTLADATRRLHRAGARGVRHVCDSGACTWRELASEVAARLNPACTVKPCTSAEFPRPAKRPAYSVLDLSVTEREIGPLPDWRDSLARVLDEIEQTAGEPA